MGVVKFTWTFGYHIPPTFTMTSNVVNKTSVFFNCPWSPSYLYFSIFFTLLRNSRHWYNFQKYQDSQSVLNLKHWTEGMRFIGSNKANLYLELETLNRRRSPQGRQSEVLLQIMVTGTMGLCGLLSLIDQSMWLVWPWVTNQGRFQLKWLIVKWTVNFVQTSPVGSLNEWKWANRLFLSSPPSIVWVLK